jgi:hypothetical protein
MSEVCFPCYSPAFPVLRSALTLTRMRILLFSLKQIRILTFTLIQIRVWILPLKFDADPDPDPTAHFLPDLGPPMLQITL